MYGHGLIHLRPSDEHFFIGILLNQKIRKSTGEQDCIKTRFLSQISPAAD